MLLRGPSTLAKGRVFVYTDASLAQELSRIGIDLSSRCIFLLELAAVCLAFKLWGNAFKGARIVCYCDNDGAKACLMTGAPNEESFQASERRKVHSKRRSFNRRGKFSPLPVTRLLRDTKLSQVHKDGDSVLPIWKRERCGLTIHLIGMKSLRIVFLFI